MNGSWRTAMVFGFGYHMPGYAAVCGTRFFFCYKGGEPVYVGREEFTYV